MEMANKYRAAGIFKAQFIRYLIKQQKTEQLVLWQLDFNENKKERAKNQNKGNQQTQPWLGSALATQELLAQRRLHCSSTMSQLKQKPTSMNTLSERCKLCIKGAFVRWNSHEDDDS